MPFRGTHDEDAKQRIREGVRRHHADADASLLRHIRMAQGKARKHPGLNGTDGIQDLLDEAERLMEARVT